MSEKERQFGVIGLGVMGSNLSLNVLDHGYSVAVWNLELERTKEFVAKHPDAELTAAMTLAELTAALERPRKILIMIKAGAPVDSVLDQLIPLLEPGDIVIDGGNSWFRDTQRRELRLREQKLNFFGVGVSGGEEGARFGPSLMPGGDAEVYRAIAPILEAISAKTDSGPCVTHIGSDGAGHFVKMVHNGIEYGDMQLIAEAYDLLHRGGGFCSDSLAAAFRGWNEGPLSSFLIEITAKIFSVADPQTDNALVEMVLDKAGQKGTGRWTAQVALELGVSIPTIAAAVDARVLSSMKAQRVHAAPLIDGPKPDPDDPKFAVQDVQDALLASKICSYAQGLQLIQVAAEQNNWSVDIKEVARIWKGGCIIRARLLDDIMQAYKENPELPNLMLAPAFNQLIQDAQPAWRRIIGLAIGHGIPVPAMAASLAYFDSYRSARLPQNLTQAQRDAFGAHTYQRVDDPEGPFVHTDWL